MLRQSEDDPKTTPMVLWKYRNINSQAFRPLGQSAVAASLSKMLILVPLHLYLECWKLSCFQDLQVILVDRSGLTTPD